MKSSLWSVTFWTLLSCLGFVFDGTLICIMTQSHSALSTSFLRVSSASVVIFFILAVRYLCDPKRGRQEWSEVTWSMSRTSYARVIIAAAGHICWAKSFELLPFTEVVTFKFMSPLVNTVVGLFILRSAINLQQIGGITCLILGTLILKSGSDFSIDTWIILYPLLAVLSLAITHYLGKEALKEPKNFPTQECLRYLVGTSILLGTGLLVFEPSSLFFDMKMFLGFGISNTIAYYGLHYGLGLGSFYYVMSLGCFRWIISLAIGVTFFGESITDSLAYGSLVVCLGLGCMIWSEMKKKRTQLAAAAS